jgi:antitoxin (DNA-binding transcriptional repressor) of toxin-antitoxin stability system
MIKPKVVIKLINTHQAKTELSSLIKDVEEGGVLVRICRNGKPVAELRKIEDLHDPLKKHPQISNIIFHEDPSAGVDTEDWPEEHR